MEEALILIGGSQGSGIETSSLILSSALVRAGYGVLSNREYYSNIVGRHSYIHLRASGKEIPRSLSYPVDLVAALDAESVFFHFDDVREGGYLVYDQDASRTKLRLIASMEPESRARIEARLKEIGAGEELSSLISALSGLGVKAVGLSFSSQLNWLSEKMGIARAEAQRFRSSIVVGAAAGLMGLSLDALEYAIERRFGKRPAVVKANKILISAVAEEVKGAVGTPLSLDSPTMSNEELMLVSGNDSVAMGKIVGGLRYQSYYPITPATDESVLHETFEALKVEGESLGSIVVLQTEDEIAAVNSAIGAALAGARASTSTSGPGFSLMVEGLGWAGMNETPVVITYYQRGGPSTGLPTRGGQTDLLFALFASHGEFPRVVISSGDHMEAFYDAVWAFNVAEKYQLPVIHLLDKFLANMITSMPLPDWSKIKIERGSTIFEAKGIWKRFDKSSVISPRPVLGSGAVTWYTGDEHNELGHITEDPINRLEMYEKRYKKLQLMDAEIAEEERALYYSRGDEDFLLVGWGSTKGPALDALAQLRKEGLRGAFLQLKVFQPFPSRLVSKVLSQYSPERIIAVEASVSSQAAKVIAMNTGHVIRKHALKWTGRPIYTMELVQAVKKLLAGSEREVMSYGK
ncbi:MAG: 2-oxoacid:acceptor oxidoreductase subunit alpha [Acidilobaceae archaeon]|nr:2-oxoacid:acceptor oxidoreductase subunit alpha [Acidilobaceae archaeon]MDW7974286.1 2-oxoacid:ferredoxin oxidoreductase subunit alpha [Sulfolobales archaeon]